jgi:hypothetical protein
VETRKTGGTDRLISSHSSILAPLSTPTERAHSIALGFGFPFDERKSVDQCVARLVNEIS